MNPRLLGVVAILVGEIMGPCKEGVLTVGAVNTGEYMRTGQAYTAACYLVDPASGGCKELLEKGLSPVPSKASATVTVVAQGGRLLSKNTDQQKGAAWCEFKAPAGCSYTEVSGNLVVILSRAQGLNPDTALPIADGCKEHVAIGTGKKADVQVRLSRRADAPPDVEIPNPNP